MNMTTKYLKTTGIQHYKLNDETYCKMIDVLKLIHHEAFMNDDKAILDVLDRMEARVSKNAFVLPDAVKPVDLKDGAAEEAVDLNAIPGRYAVGRQHDDGEWEFYAGSVDGDVIITERPCKAELFVAYKDAEANADFLPGDGWLVLDMEENMTEEDRWVREMLMPFPYDLDEGFENSVPLVIEQK